MCVCVCACKGERESVCVCVCVRVCMFATKKKERERERERIATHHVSFYKCQTFHAWQIAQCHVSNRNIMHAFLTHEFSRSHPSYFNASSTWRKTQVVAAHAQQQHVFSRLLPYYFNATSTWRKTRVAAHAQIQHICNTYVATQSTNMAFNAPSLPA